MMAAMRSVSRETTGIWLLIASLLFASVEAAADRSHAHADPAPAQHGSPAVTEEGSDPAGDAHADCPHCFHLNGLVVQCAPPSAATVFPAAAFEPLPPSGTSPTWRPSPPLRPPIAG
jgi:hypothetical protein